MKKGSLAFPLQLLLGCLLAWPPAHAQQLPGSGEPPTAVPYEVQPGDTLWDIATRHFGRALDWFRIRDLNSLRQPDLIHPRQKLLLYRSGTVFVVAARGPVQAVMPGGAAQEVRPGTMLDEGVNLRTGDNGFVTIELPDGSRTTLPSHASVHVRRTDQGMPVLRLDAGDLEARVPARSPASLPAGARLTGDSFRVESPRATVGVRGTVFRVSVPDPQTTTIGVLESHVSASGSGLPAAPVNLSEAQGVLAGDAPGAGIVQDLLPAPAWQWPGQMQPRNMVGLQWQPVAGAARYRVQLGRDIEFTDLQAEHKTSGADELSTLLPDVPDGHWFARVSAIAPDGLEGLPAVQTFLREQWRIAQLAAEVHGDAVELSWQGPPDAVYELEVASDAEFTQMAVREQGLRAFKAHLSALPPGRYWWRLKGQWTEQGAQRVLQSPAQSFAWEGAR